MIKLPASLKNSLLVMALGFAGHGHLPGKVSFNNDIRPIMSDTCFQCHGPDANAREADLRLDIREEAVADRDGSPAIVPGDPEASLMIWMINAEDEEDRMPPLKHQRTLTAGEKQLFADWIAEGAEYQEHWAYIPPVKKQPPDVSNEDWPKNEIDRFVLAKLTDEGLAPSTEADKETLIRRLSLDLTGLPPTLDEVDAFLADDSPNAYEKLVNRLMASTAYGERMVWEWLDAARYADSNGYQQDPDRGMWPWRDWAIKALNDNMPYDQFTIEQIGGDLLPNPTRDQKLATAFLRNHMINGEGGRLPEENRIEYLFDQAETVATVWMGVTMNCARCHDHKYDPVTQREYYQLIAFFDKTEVSGKGRDPHTPPALDLTTQADRDRLDELEAEHKRIAREVDEMEKLLFPRPEGEGTDKSERAIGLEEGRYLSVFGLPAAKRIPENSVHFVRLFQESDPEYSEAIQRLMDAHDAMTSYSNRMPIVMIMEDTVQRDTFMLERGVYSAPTEKVVTGFPAIMNGGLIETGNFNRLDLANWLVSKEHPLMARVTVNRYWHLFFGQGLLKQVEDFGVQSPPPEYEDLLDWLAVDFRESGWDVKGIQKKILMSATYRQSSKVSNALQQRDPENRLLARGPRFRMPSWMIRDQALAMGGLLVETCGGPPVKPYQPDGIWKEASFGFIKYVPDHGDALYRRSLYTFWRRIVGPPLFFDSGARQVCQVKSQRTNTPLHALTTLNDVTFAEAARAFAERVLTQPGLSETARLRQAFRMATTRFPEADELKTLRGAIDKYRHHFKTRESEAIKVISAGESPYNKHLDGAEHAAWSTLCLLLLNLDETLTKE